MRYNWRASANIETNHTWVERGFASIINMGLRFGCRREAGRDADGVSRTVKQLPQHPSPTFPRLPLLFDIGKIMVTWTYLYSSPP